MPNLPKDLKNLTRQQDGSTELLPPKGKHSDPSGYQPGDALVAAVKVALLLRKPLLLTGRPGTGKTELGHYLAWKMKCDVFQFDAKSTSIARDLFYVYDAIGYYRSGAGADILDFLSFQALGKAILRCADRTVPGEEALQAESEDARKTRQVHEEIRNTILKGYETGARQSVVIIDEIDKAPRDFPNDLLNEIDNWYFHIPEWQNVKIKALKASTPILVITSNSEKNLPAAFLRRCVYYDIPFPDQAQLRTILSGRIDEFAVAPDAPAGPETNPLIESATLRFLALTADNAGLKQPPGTAEFIDWVRCMLLSGAQASTDLLKAPDAVGFMKAALPALVKSPEDIKRVNELLGIPAT
jgi:MoxR-like ATPase